VFPTSHDAGPGAQVNNDPTGAAGVVEIALGLPADIAPGTYTLFLVDESQHQSNAITLILEGTGYTTPISENGPQIYSIARNRAWIASPMPVGNPIGVERETAHCSG
jgi:hypothetical protein